MESNVKSEVEVEGEGEGEATLNTDGNGLKQYINCCSRLMQLLDIIEKDELDQEGLVSYLTSVAESMEKLAKDPQFLLEDEIIASVDQEVIPEEIRIWLAATFTNAPKAVKTSERPTFRAVANAILATIMVEKIFKKSNENAAVKIPPAVSKVLDNSINNWDFNIFGVVSLTEGHTLKYLVMYIFLNHEILRKYKISFELLEAFLNEIQDGYIKAANPYTCDLHAGDVLQTIHFFVSHYQLALWMTDLQVFSMFFSAIIHCYDNKGVTNKFLVETRNVLALFYNDNQVNENHALSSAFKILQDPSKNCLRGLSKDEFIEFRRNVVECVLSMEITQHFHLLRQTKNDVAMNTEIDKMKVMCFLLHAADLSQPTKDSSIYLQWVDLWELQLFNQGEAEYALNIPYSPMCNRETHNRYDVQSAFILYIVEPMFQFVGSLLDDISSTNKLATNGNVSDQNLQKKSSNLMAIYPWENKIILNKSMWQKKNIAKKRSTDRNSNEME